MTDPKAIIAEDTKAISPFWRRLPWFFAFPLQADVLARMLLLSLLGFLADLVAWNLFLVLSVIGLLALRQGFDAMEAVSQGRLTAKHRMTFIPGPGGAKLPWKALALFMLWAMLLTSLVSADRVFLGSVVALLLSVSLPACVMVLSTTNSLSQALNPANWLFVIRQVGKPYVLLVVFLLLLLDGTPRSLDLLVPLVGVDMALPTALFTVLYVSQIMFAMMGYALYQFQQVLGLHGGYGVVRSGRRSETRGVTGANDTSAEGIALRLAEGDEDGAVELAYEQQRLNPYDLAIQDRYHKLLLLADRKDRALAHGQRYLRLLVRLARNGEALELLLRLRELDPDFLPDSPELRLPLATAAFERGDTDATVVALVRSFDRYHPHHPDVPAVYFLSARLMNERLGNHDAALVVLRAVRQKFPEHPLTPAVERYQTILERQHDGQQKAGTGIR
ncbi:MAG: hypothetical protein V5B60_09770 [Accumulibacter sp.]|uniref:hypothetical protein n=1 Tax=Accumulibacter sp. TaxID=2053492 RepID=UPI002FC3B34E